MEGDEAETPAEDGGVITPSAPSACEEEDKDKVKGNVSREQTEAKTEATEELLPTNEIGHSEMCHRRDSETKAMRAASKASSNREREKAEPASPLLDATLIAVRRKSKKR